MESGPRLDVYCSLAIRRKFQWLQSCNNFTPLQFTLMSSTENVQCRRIMTRDAIEAYLQVLFSFVGEKFVSADLIKGTSQTKMRNRHLQVLHGRIVLSRCPLFEAVLKRIVCSSEWCSWILLYLLLESYIADIQECKDFLSLKRGSSKASPCHLCTVRSSELCASKPMLLRLLRTAKNVFEILSDSHRNNDEGLAIHKYSMLPMLPVLHAFPMVEIHSCEDICAIYWIVLIPISSQGLI